MTAFRLADPRQLVALGFGAGLVPRVPGTAASVLTLPLAWLLADLPLAYYVALVVIAFALGCWVCGATARLIGVHDHPAIVWDEVTGMLLAVAGFAGEPVALVAGLVLFRFFDVLKPWPISLLERRLGGGLGIMLDDVVAGAASLACLLVGYHLLPGG